MIAVNSIFITLSLVFIYLVYKEIKIDKNIGHSCLIFYVLFIRSYIYMYVSCGDSYIDETIFFEVSLIYMAFLLCYTYSFKNREQTFRFSFDNNIQLSSDKLKKLFLFSAIIGLWFNGAASAEMITSQDILRLKELRFINTKGSYFTGKYNGSGLINTYLFIAFSLMCVVSLWRLRKYNNKKEIIGFIVIFLTGAFLLYGIGSRGPLINFCLIQIPIFTYIFQIRIKILFVFIGFALIFFMLISFKSNKIINVDDDRIIKRGFENIITRGFFANSSNDKLLMELLHQKTIKHSYGYENFRNLITSIPGINFGKPLAFKLFAMSNLFTVNSTFLSGTYLMTCYCDFGLIGCIILYGCMGILVKQLKIISITHNNNLNKGSFLFGGFTPYLTFSLLTIGFSGLLAVGVLFCLIVLYLQKESNGNNIHMRLRPQW